MKILLGMSGGVDSTFAAYKLLEEGHTVEGAVLLMHEYTDLKAARESADSLGIPLHVLDGRELFESTVVPNFISEYKHGRTPNPCIICNREVKFRILCDFARENGFDKVATGHYAEVIRLDTPCGERFALKYASDVKKDQTYMLWRLSQDELAMLYLPLFNITKEEIREISRQKGLFAADREDSQEICFIPSGDYPSYIEERAGKAPIGDFVDENGNVIGQHRGIIHYTVGQRKGLGIALGKRAFITDIDPKTNRITLSTAPEFNPDFYISDMIFSGMCEPNAGDEMTLSVKVRHQSERIPATVKFVSSGSAKITLHKMGKAVTRGQSAVLYDGDILVAGGIISG